MKRIRIDQQSLRALYPPMDAAFERELRQRIRGLPQGKESQYMRRKTGLAVLLAALLAIALAATALAAFAVSHGFFEEVARVQLESGYYDDWSLEDKEAIVRLMEENGILENPSPWEAALALRDAAAREAALDALFAARYGVGGRTDVVGIFSILEAEKGTFDTWSMEEKAWYSALMLDLGLAGYDSEVFLLPGEDAITAEEAERIAREAVIDAYGLAPDALEGYTAGVDCCEHVSEAGIKPPYFFVLLSGGEEEPPYGVAVSQKGRVLSSGDGYLGVTSPQEDAEAARREEQAPPADEVLAAHTAELPELEAQVVTLESAMVQAAVSLADGKALVAGVTLSETGAANGTFALSIDEAGQVLWRRDWAKTHDGNTGIKAAMQLESGEIQLLRERWINGKQSGDLEICRYDLIRLDADGQELESFELPAISALTGMKSTSYELMFGQPGHGGLLVFGPMTSRNVMTYTALNAQGEAQFVLPFDELRSYAPYLKTTQEGYLLTAWNETAQRPILRFYDAQGNVVREGADDPALTGLRINRVLSAGDGTLMAASGFMRGGEWVLAHLGADGALLDKAVCADGTVSFIGMPTEIVCVNGRYAYAAMHHSAASGGETAAHLGLILSSADGSIREYALEGVETTSPWGECQLAALGKESVLLTQNGDALAPVPFAAELILAGIPGE